MSCLDSMDTLARVRVKLVTAAVSLSLICAVGMLHAMAGHGAAGTVLQVVSLVFAVAIAFFGVFRNAQLQLLWGWGLATAAPFLLALCILEFRGAELIWGLVSALGASLGAYLLIGDRSVRAYREGMRVRRAGDDHGA